MNGPSSNGKAGRRTLHGRTPVRDAFDLQDWLDAEVYPALYRRLDRAFPEFGWVSCPDRWEATDWPLSFPVTVTTGERPGRLMVYADRPWWVKVHGRGGVRFLDYVARSERPKGQAFLDACGHLADLAGVKMPQRKQTPEQMEQARLRERRRDFLDCVIRLYEEVLWGSRGGEKALAYLTGRGLGEGEVRAFHLGLCDRHHPAGRVREVLAAEGWPEDAIDEEGRAFGKLAGYVVVPWMDELGRPLTLYGRWPGNDLPRKFDRRAWRKERDRERGAWEAKPAGARPDWQEPLLPKTFALPGKDSKSAPLYLDRARKAGGEVVVVEGVLDALTLQARGEARAVASVAGQLSGEQLKTLARCNVARAYVCGDPDGGGDAGTVRNVVALARHGVTPYVVPRLPDRTDPDEFVNARGIDAWRELVRSSRHGYRHLSEQLIAAHAGGMGQRQPGDDQWDEALKAAALKSARELPADNPDWLSRYFLPPIAERIGARVEDLLAEVRATRRGPPPGEGDAPPAAGASFTFDPIDSAAFDALDCRPTWLVKRLLVKDQPAVIGGPQKSLKTSVGIDLAVSLASATPFLGTLDVYKRARVAVLSGESGRWALQSLARRVCAARGLRFGDLAGSLLWQTTLPKLADVRDLAELSAGLKRRAVELVIVDPLYMALLAGGTDLQASNLFDMGPLLLGVARACLDAGCTPALVHHTTKPSNASRDPLQLADLAFAGLPEFARQWLLINRRETFTPPGPHKLWLSAGGSCGQGGLWALDVEEGELGEDFGGRHWQATLRTAGDELSERRHTADQQKRRKEAEKEAVEEGRFLEALGALDPGRQGVTVNAIRTQAGLSGERATAVKARLLARKIVEDVTVTVAAGKGVTSSRMGVRLRSEEGEPR